MRLSVRLYLLPQLASYLGINDGHYLANNRYDLAIKNAIRAESAPEQPPTSSAPRATTRSLSFTAQATRTGGTPNSKSQTQPTTTFRRDPKATARVKFPSLVGRRLRIAQEDQSVPDAEKEKD